jgi:hypothetical protein
MALLVATAGNPKRATGGAHGLSGMSSNDSQGTRGSGEASRSRSTVQSTTTTTRAPAQTAATALTSTHSATVPTTTQATTPSPSPAPVTTTTVAPTTTTTTNAAPQSLGAGSHQGVLEPPAQRSSSVGFTGTGAMQISVVWSGSTYLTMQVSCPSGTQDVGGSSAMQASLADASGSCLATVSEPASESATLTYTITIGPSGG